MSSDQTDHQPLPAAPSPLGPGTPAPDFRLPCAPEQTIALSSRRGQQVILVFYLADWSPVCGDQLTLYQEFLPAFRQLGAALLAISVDGVWCHQAFARHQGLEFPLLADFEPKGAVAHAYGVYRPQDGTSARALFVLDAAGIIRWSYLSPGAVNPGADGILTALEALVAEAAPSP